MKISKNILILTIIFIIFYIISYSKIGSVFIDFSRESYIPYQILNGKILFKDIFLIYGIWGYLVNALLLNCSINTNILLIEAGIISYLSIILYYFICKKFLSKIKSLIATIIFLATSVFSISTFAYIFPYSFSSLWGYFSIYLILFAILYDRKNILYLSLGLLLTSRFEFFILILPIIIFYFFQKKEKIGLNSLYMLVFPAITLLYIIANHITIQDILTNFSYIKKMSQTNALIYFYKGMGAFFSLDYLKYNILKTSALIITSAISYILYKKNFKIVSFLVILIYFITSNLFISFNLSAIFAIALGVILIFKKALTKNEIILLIFSLVLCSKAIFAINPVTYSNYGFCFLILFIYLQAKKILNENWLNNYLILFFIFNFIFSLAHYIQNPMIKYNTQIGPVPIYKKQQKAADTVNNFIKKNVKNNENFIVIPEGQIFNLIHKKDYSFYNSTFTPLDFETFGDEKLIEQLKKDKTTYIFLFPRETMEYGAKNFGKDYAVDFYKYIIDNYEKITLDDILELEIYKLKE